MTNQTPFSNESFQAEKAKKNEQAESQIENLAKTLFDKVSELIKNKESCYWHEGTDENRIPYRYAMLFKITEIHIAQNEIDRPLDLFMSKHAKLLSDRDLEIELQFAGAFYKGERTSGTMTYYISNNHKERLEAKAREKMSSQRTSPPKEGTWIMPVALSLITLFIIYLIKSLTLMSPRINNEVQQNFYRS